MRFYKNIVGIIMVMLMTISLCINNVPADDSAASDKGGSVTSDNSGDAGDTAPVFEPKIMVESYNFSKKTIYAGSSATVNIVLVNTSTTSAIKNMMATASIENENFQLTGKTDSAYIPYIAAGGRYTLSFSFKSKSDTPRGQYDLSLNMDYADKDGATYSSTGKAKIDIVQKTRVKFDNLVISSEAEAGDTIEAQVNAMNLGKETVKNVRAVIKADGLTPKGTLYIGDIEGGQMGQGTVSVDVGAMSRGESEYGKTKGKVIFYYEGGNGKTKKVKKSFELNIKPLNMSQDTDTKKEDNAGQWWIVTGVVSGLIVIILVVIIVGAIRKKNGAGNEMAK